MATCFFPKPGGKILQLLLGMFPHSVLHDHGGQFLGPVFRVQPGKTKSSPVFRDGLCRGIAKQMARWDHANRMPHHAQNNLMISLSPCCLLPGKSSFLISAGELSFSCTSGHFVRARFSWTIVEWFHPVPCSDPDVAAFML